MNTEITSKSEVDTIKSKLNTDVSNTRTYIDKVNTTLSSIESYEEFDLSSVANTISSNFNNIVTDLETISKNVSSYIDNLVLIDQDTKEIEEVDGNEFKDIAIPAVPSPSSRRSSNNTHSNNGSYNNNSPRNNPLTQTYSRSSSNNGGAYAATGAAVASSAKHLTNPSTSGSSNKTSNNQSNNSPNTSSNFNTTPATNKGDSNVDISKYRNRPEAGFQVTTGNLAYDLSDSDIDLLCAIVAAESDKSYDDALAVITTILNRCEAPNWVASHGKNPVAQATAPNQFVVYQHGSYRRYINGNAPDTVKQAVADALAGVRNHNYLSFRSNGSTGYSNNMITSSGNRYK